MTEQAEVWPIPRLRQYPQHPSERTTVLVEVAIRELGEAKALLDIFRCSGGDLGADGREALRLLVRRTLVVAMGSLTDADRYAGSDEDLREPSGVVDDIELPRVRSSLLRREFDSTLGSVQALDDEPARQVEDGGFVGAFGESLAGEVQIGDVDPSAVEDFAAEAGDVVHVPTVPACPIYQHKKDSEGSS